MDDKQRRFEHLLADLAKGILLGAALGLIFSWTGLMDMARAVFLGMLCGCLAAVSFARMRKRKGDSSKNDNDNE